MLLFYFFAAIQIFFSFQSLLGGFRYLNYFKSELGDLKPEFSPHASIIVPCRGLETGLNGNLEALFSQDYPSYEVIFVVQSDDDEALTVIKDLENQAVSFHVVVAGEATGCGQKVHNLRTAILEVSDDSEVFVFVDSDARPGPDWLVNLVAPLKDEGIGCTTGYRWFIQETDGFFTYLRSVWNASIASALGEDGGKNFCWGGSTAIRRSVFERLDIRERWRGVLSDDFALTTAIHKADLNMKFVPQCLTPSVGDCGLRDLVEFTTRQMKITRVYSSKLWAVSFMSAFLFCAVTTSSIFLLFYLSGAHFWVVAALLLIMCLLGTLKAWLRLKAVGLVLTEYKSKIEQQTFWQLSLWTISPFLFLFNNIQATLSRRIVWRGTEYELKSEQETVIINRDA